MSALTKIIPFDFENHSIRASVINGEPWFVASDICRALKLSNTSESLRNLDEDEKGISSTDTPSGAQEMLVISESGLFTLILRCRDAVKPGTNPHRFRKWVTAEVLPAIRKHGSYTDTHNKMGTLIGETIGTNGFNMLGAVVKGKVSSLPVPVQRRATAKIWSQTHAAFGVRSAADIPATQLDAARNFIAAYALEGEWLPPVLPGEELGEHAAGNLRALCHHAEWLLRNWNATLEPALRQVHSPLASSFHEHFVSVACLGRALLGPQKLAG